MSVTTKAGTTADAVRRRVARMPSGSFVHVSKLAAVVGSPRAVETTLWRLKEAGELVPVRKGLYWKGVRSRYGAGRPSHLAVALEVTGPGTGPTGWTAAHALGLSTQVPAVAELAVLGAAPTGLRGVRCSLRRHGARTKLRYLEVGLLEVLTAYPRFCEADWPSLVRRVGELVADGTIRLDRVAAVGRAERRPALRAHLEPLVAELGAVGAVSA